MTRVQYALLFFSCIIFPYMCAIAAFFTQAILSSHHRDVPASLGIVGIPCLLVGTLGGQVVSMIQGYGKRIAELERRLNEKHGTAA